MVVKEVVDEVDLALVEMDLEVVEEEVDLALVEMDLEVAGTVKVAAKVVRVVKVA